MSTVPSPERPDDREPSPSLSDEQLDAFLRESAEGGGAAPKEPSARARMVTERLRAQDEAAASASGGRRWGREKAAPPSTPPGWRTGPAWQGTNGGRSRMRRVGAAVGVVLAVALAVVAVKPSLVLDRIPGRETEAEAAVPPPLLPAETALPTDAPGQTAQAEQPTHADPFRGSPALRWEEGADAIRLPEAKAVGGMSKAEVQLALERTKEFLVASNLDPAVLRGERPDKAIAVLEPLDSAMLSRIERSLTGPTRDDDPVTLFSRFDPARVRVLGDVVKVRGHMTFAAGETGQVDVHADYTFVYPLVQADVDEGPVERTIVRRDITMSMADPRHWQSTRGKPAIKKYEVATYNNECGVYDGYLHPVFPGTAPTGAPATGPTADPYDRRKALAEDRRGGCGTVSRT
ncbi:hypothetical protein [Streptomyces flaveolus]|uniref:hypothetical protein n=1 Tax=Streptomyces flaveolus TaxID=67297 RepID=UPI0036FA34FE